MVLGSLFVWGFFRDSLNERGEVRAVNISNHTRDPMLRVPVDQVLPMYRALDKYFHMLQQPEYMFKYKMQEGTNIPSYGALEMPSNLLRS